MRGYANFFAYILNTFFKSSAFKNTLQVISWALLSFKEYLKAKERRCLQVHFQERNNKWRKDLAVTGLSLRGGPHLHVTIVKVCESGLSLV